MVSVERLLEGSEREFESMAVCLIADRLQAMFFSVKDALATGPKDNSVVLQVYPELRDLHTDEDLLVLQAPMIAMAQGIFYKEHVLHYHQLLRRGYSSNPNMDFLARLTAFHRGNADAKVAVAIDHRRLMPKEYFREFFERDMWFGPPFREQDLDDPRKVGLTIVGRSDPAVHSRNAALCRLEGIERCEVLWTCRDGIKTAQIEEVSSMKTSEGLTINRYVHSYRDLATRAFVHLDGACKVYSEDQLEPRLNTRMPDVPRARQKPKLFRIDGKVALESWSELICFFFRGNPLILEYFVNP